MKIQPVSRLPLPVETSRFSSVNLIAWDLSIVPFPCVHTCWQGEPWGLFVRGLVNKQPPTHTYLRLPQIAVVVGIDHAAIDAI